MSYWILGTDYRSYAVAWTCLPIGLNHEKYLWMNTRQRNPDSAVIKKARAVIVVANRLG